MTPEQPKKADQKVLKIKKKDIVFKKKTIEFPDLNFNNMNPEKETE